MYVFMYLCIYVYMYLCMYMYVYVCICIYIYMRKSGLLAQDRRTAAGI